MKIKDIISEDMHRREFDLAMPDSNTLDLEPETNEFEDEDLEVATATKVDPRVEQAIVNIVRKLIAQTITEIETPVIINSVVSKLKIPFTHIDLVKINNASPKIQHYIDTIDLKKVKFKTDGLLTAKNEDPEKQQQKAEENTVRTVGGMAKHALNNRK
jgi:hypothetical protein